MAASTAEVASWPAVIEGREKELHFSCMNVQCDWSEAVAKCVTACDNLYIMCGVFWTEETSSGYHARDQVETRYSNVVSFPSLTQSLPPTPTHHSITHSSLTHPLIPSLTHLLTQYWTPLSLYPLDTSHQKWRQSIVSLSLSLSLLPALVLPDLFCVCGPHREEDSPRSPAASWREEGY